MAGRTQGVSLHVDKLEEHFQGSEMEDEETDAMIGS